MSPKSILSRWRFHEIMWNVTVMTWRFIMLAARKDGQTLP